MIPVAFDYKKAISVDEALSALTQGEGKILAGGYSLLPAMKLRLSQPGILVDISSISSLKGIREENGHLVIGAATTHDAILTNKLIQEKLPFFTTAAGMIGDVQVRNRGTIGGSIAHADPAADWPAPVLAAGGIIDITGPGGTRNVAATEFFTGLYSTLLAENEIITAIRLPVPEAGCKMVYLKFPHPASRFAMVGCAVLHGPSGKTSIAFTGVADHAFRDAGAEEAITGKLLDKAAIERAVNSSTLNSVHVMGDQFASVEYRRHLAKIYLKRALEAVSA